jgi:hypothetical protein
MPAIRLSDIEQLTVPDGREGLALQALKIFPTDGPLQDNTLLSWMLQHKLSKQTTVSILQYAIDQGWVQDSSVGMTLTSDGLAKSG